MRSGRPVGSITRGTTNPNRLRRVDRWIAAVLAPALRRHRAPVVVDLGFGATPVTTLELQQRLRGPVPDVHVAGLEIDPARVAAARASHPRQDFALGGFELGPFAGRAVLVRAFNVLRQYEEAQVAAAWRTMADACVADGIVIDGTCDELGRLASWIRLDSGAPTSLTVSLRLAGLNRPSAVAARLPKALIHHNVPGTAVHGFLASLDAGWSAAAGLQSLSARQRWLQTVAAARSDGFRILDGPGRWRLGEVTVAWSDVAP